VQEGCKKILVSDYFNLHEKLVSTQQRGIAIDGKRSKLKMCIWVLEYLVIVMNKLSDNYYLFLGCVSKCVHCFCFWMFYL
jgi:hypothetical protein